MLPRGVDELPDHLAEVARDAKALLEETERVLGGQPPLVSLEDHYRDSERFPYLPGVREMRGRRIGLASRVYRVATGTETHVVSGAPSVPGCVSRLGCMLPRGSRGRHRAAGDRDRVASEKLPTSYTGPRIIARTLAWRRQRRPLFGRRAGYSAAREAGQTAGRSASCLRWIRRSVAGLASSRTSVLRRPPLSYRAGLQSRPDATCKSFRSSGIDTVAHQLPNAGLPGVPACRMPSGPGSRNRPKSRRRA